MALSAAGMAGPKSGPADFRPVYDSPSPARWIRTTVSKKYKSTSFWASGLVAGSIETGSFHLLLLSRLRVSTHSFRGVLFYGRLLCPIAWLIVVPVQFHLVIAGDDGLFCNFR